MYHGVVLSDLNALPEALKVELFTDFEDASWTEEPDGSISNLDRFDSRFSPWGELVEFLYSTPLENSDFVAHIFYGLSGEMCEYARFCAAETPPPPNALTALKHWPGTKKIEFEDPSTLILRMGNLQSSLSFILNLYENLPREKSIQRDPRTSYAATLVLRFKNLHVFVDLHRDD